MDEWHDRSVAAHRGERWLMEAGWWQFEWRRWTIDCSLSRPSGCEAGEVGATSER